jgi:osmotically inducible protein OsmC
MPVRQATAVWKGGLKDGNGTVKLGSGAFEGQYSFGTRFEEGRGTNPEELLGAAHAGCFAMALSAGLGKAGFTPESIQAQAKVNLEKQGDGFAITRIDLVCEAKVPRIDEAAFRQHAEQAKANCLVSKALTGVKITLAARLLQPAAVT